MEVEVTGGIYIRNTGRKCCKLEPWGGAGNVDLCCQRIGDSRIRGHVDWNVLRVPWTARGSNQSILKEISPGCSLEGLMLKLKLQYFGHLMRRVDSLEKTLMLGGIGGRKRRGRQRMRWLDGITDLMDMNLSNSGSWWWTRRPGVLQFMGLQRLGHDWVTELNSQCIETEWIMVTNHPHSKVLFPLG